MVLGSAKTAHNRVPSDCQPNVRHGGHAAAHLRAWRKRNGFNQTQAGETLGSSLPQIQRYEDGAEIPRRVELAMAAVEAERYAPLMMREVWARLRGEG